MEETATQTATEQIDNPEPPKVKDPEAVLRKNEELLGKLSKAKEAQTALEAKIAQFEAAERERETKALEKKGEWETLRENLTNSHKEALTAKEAEIAALFEDSARFQLSTELGKHAILEGTAERLAKLLLLDEIKPAREDGKVVWRKKATDEAIALHEYIPSIQEAYGEFFKADHNPGSDAPGNTGRQTTSSTKGRSQYSTRERVEYIKTHGLAKWEALPN